MKDLLYICNPIAGRGKARERLSGMIEFYNSCGFIPRVYMTGPDRDLKEAFSLFPESGFLVCSGGDGMLNLMINTLSELGIDVPIGYIPMGTTNDFSKTIGLPKKFEDVLRTSVSEYYSRIDAGELEGRRFAYVAGFGNFTDISYKTPQISKNMLGYLAYLLEGARSISDIKPYHVKVTAGEEILEGDYVFGLVTNSTSVAGVRPPSGAATKLDDGLMELTLIRMPRNLAELRELAGSYLTSDGRSELIECRQGREFGFEAEKLDWTLDGEFGGCYDKCHISVLPKVFAVRRPEPPLKTGNNEAKKRGKDSKAERQRSQQ